MTFRLVTQAALPTCGLLLSLCLLGTFTDYWMFLNPGDRALAILVVISVWGVVAAAMATVRQAFAPIPLLPPNEMDDPADPGEHHDRGTKAGGAVFATVGEPL